MMYEMPFHTTDLSKIKVLVTGGAGFIGSNIVEYLLKYNIGQVKVLDNFSTGYLSNIEDFLKLPNIELIEGDIRNLETCQKACEGMDYVLHQAALGSVPRSINDPITTNEVNIDGFLNILVAIRDQKVKRVVYAASSSTYGDSTDLPKVEGRIGSPLSPYAVTKHVNELYADVFAKTYGIETIGLRYFNVFGPKQRIDGEYLAVIPAFCNAILNNERPIINGDGTTSRDFTFVENVVQANIKAMFVGTSESVNTIYNIAHGKATSLNQLFKILSSVDSKDMKPVYREERLGDVKHTQADTSKAIKFLGYSVPEDNYFEKTYLWYKFLHKKGY